MADWVTIHNDAQMGDCTRHRIGPWESSEGAIYVIAPDKVALQISAYKSIDGGNSWVKIPGPTGLSDQYSGFVYSRTVEVCRNGDSDSLWCIYPTGSELELTACEFDMATDAWGAEYASEITIDPSLWLYGIDPPPGGVVNITGWMGDHGPFKFGAEILSDDTIVVCYSSMPYDVIQEAPGGAIQWLYGRCAVVEFEAGGSGKGTWGSRTVIMPDGEGANACGVSLVSTALGEDDVVHLVFEWTEYYPETDTSFGPFLHHGVYNGSWLGSTRVVEPTTYFLEPLQSPTAPAYYTFRETGKDRIRIFFPLHGNGNADPWPFYWGLSYLVAEAGETTVIEEDIDEDTHAQVHCGFTFFEGDAGILCSPSAAAVGGLVDLPVYRASTGAFAMEAEKIVAPEGYTNAFCRTVQNTLGILITGEDSGPGDGFRDHALRFRTIGIAEATIVGGAGIPSAEAFGAANGVRGGADAMCEVPDPNAPGGDASCGDPDPAPVDRDDYPRCGQHRAY